MSSRSERDETVLVDVDMEGEEGIGSGDDFVRRGEMIVLITHLKDINLQVAVLERKFWNLEDRGGLVIQEKQ